jgi:hypothetical protein
VGRDHEQLVIGPEPDARRRPPVSGNVATASAVFRNRGTSKPNRFGYHRCTRGLVLGLPREVRRTLPQRGLHRGVTLGREVARVEAEVDVARRRPQRAVVQRVEDDVADRAGVDQPVWRVDIPRRFERGD